MQVRLTPKELGILIRSKGSEKALASLQKDFGRQVFASVRRFVTASSSISSADVDDIVQLVWLAVFLDLQKVEKLWRNYEELVKSGKPIDPPPDHTGLSSWLYRISRNTFLNFIRTKIKQNEANLDDCLNQISNSFDPLERIITDESLRIISKTISNNELEILKMYYIENLSAREIGEQFGKSEGNVRFIVFQANRKLREKLL